MEDKYFIKGTDETPEINFDKAGNCLKISGVSMPENALDFYLPAISWLIDLKKSLASMLT